MKTLTTKIARFIIIGAVMAGSAAHAEDSAEQELANVTQIQVVTEMKEVTTSLTQDFQQQLSNSIKQQVTSTVNIITASLKEALLPSDK